MTDCIFCKILAGEIPSDKVLETDTVYAFRDINPQAPKHVLVIPKEHVASLEDLDDGHRNLAGDLVLAAQQAARQEGVAESGYRTVINCGDEGGQDVAHLHMHMLGGRRMQWPPG